MATLTSQTIAGTYKDLLKINANAYQSGVDGTLRVVEDGDATASALWLSTGSVALGVDDTGADFRVYSATTNEGLFYDASEDEFGLLLTTKLKFHDIGGGEEIYASANGHLEINAGTTLDITAPTVDLNSATEFNIDTAIYDLNASGAITINSSGGTIGVGNDNVDQTINIGTAGTRTLNIGINDGTDLTTIAVNGPVTIDRNTAGDSAENGKGLYVDFDRSVATGGTNAHNDIGFDLDVNSRSLGTSTVIGMDIDVVGHTDGTSTATGLTVDVGSATTNYAAIFNGGNVGIGVAAPLGALHLAHDGTGDIYWGSHNEYGKIRMFIGEWDASSSATVDIALGDDAEPYWVHAYEALVVMRNSGTGNAYAYNVRGVFAHETVFNVATNWAEEATAETDPAFEDTGTAIVLKLTSPETTGTTGYSVLLTEIRTQ